MHYPKFLWGETDFYRAAKAKIIYRLRIVRLCLRFKYSESSIPFF
jgi:hypothetical protein